MMRTILLLFFLCSSALSYSQKTSKFEYPMPHATAPQVSSLMKQVDYPVSLYTGLVNIEIPLYEIKEGDITLPISLQYHASGIKVFDFDGQVGAGWSLSSDISISRKVSGLPDDGTCQYFDQFFDNRYQWLSLLNNQIDSEPDIYYYKLLDKSGKFYFSKNTFGAWDGRIVTNPYEPIRIEASKGGIINAFHIVNDNGMRYDFSERLADSWYLTRITSANSQHHLDLTYNEDYLTSKLVQNPDYIGVSEMVRRFYVQEFFANQGKDYSYPYITMFQKGSYNILSHQNPREIDKEPVLEKIDDEMPFPVSPNGPVITTSATKYLKTIESSYVRVEFTGSQNITSVIVRNKKNREIIRSIYFYYSKNKSTTLDRVEIVGKDEQKEVYLMTYNATRLINTDKTHNKGIDHWGYYNGYDQPMNGNTTLIPMSTLKTREYLPCAWANPRTPIDVGVATEDWQYDPVKILIKDLPYRASQRHAVSEAMQHAMLTSITYPTGRKSIFFYEAHQYLHKYSEEKKYNFGHGSDEWSNDDYEDGEPVLPDEVKHAGGLRIKKIEEYDPVTEVTLTKEYKYGKKEDGVGFIKHQIDIEDYCYEIYEVGVTYIKVGPNHEVKEPHILKSRMYTKFAIPSLFFGNGSTTVYDYVTEYTVNNATGEKLKSTFHYDAEKISQAYRMGYTQLLFDPLTDWRYGQLLDKIDYKYLNGEYRKVQHKKNVYQEYGHDSTPYTKIWRYMLISSDYDSRNPYEDITNYELDYPYAKYEIGHLFSGCKYPSQEATTMYAESGDSISSVVRYDYLDDAKWPYHIKGSLLIKKATMTSGGAWNTEKYSYPLNSHFTNEEESARLKLIENNQIHARTRKEVLNGNTHSIEKIHYLISPDSGLPLPATITTNTKADNSDEERVKVLKYDSYGNPVHIRKDGNDVICLWSYGGQYLVAEIQNATYEEVDQSLLAVGLNSIKSLSENMNSNKQRLDDLRNIPSSGKFAITTYQYQPAVGITSMTDSRGVSTYYEYDGFDRLNAVKNHDENTLNRYYYKYSNQ